MVFDSESPLHFNCRGIVMQTGTMILMIDLLFLVFTGFLDAHQSHGILRSNKLCPARVQRQNTWLPMPQPSYYGYNLFYPSCMFLISVFPTLWFDDINTIALSANPVRHSKTKHLWTRFALCKREQISKSLSVQHVPLMINRRIFLPRRCLHSKLNVVLHPSISLRWVRSWINDHLAIHLTIQNQEHVHKWCRW